MELEEQIDGPDTQQDKKRDDKRADELQNQRHASIVSRVGVAGMLKRSHCLEFGDNRSFP
jgi:hypothetical protein